MILLLHTRGEAAVDDGGLHREGGRVAHEYIRESGAYEVYLDCHDRRREDVDVLDVLVEQRDVDESGGHAYRFRNGDDERCAH